METGNTIAEIAALLGDPGRAAMLANLMDGRALTAKELASVAHITPATASGHLAKLTRSGLLSGVAQGRHRYFRLASADVAAMIEGIMVVAKLDDGKSRVTPRIDPKLRNARSCYDHLAGRVAVSLADVLVAEGSVELGDGIATISVAGAERLRRFGLELPSGAGAVRPLCRPCLDWSERRPHLAGSLGAALFDRLLSLDWLRRERVGRAVTVTSAGRLGLAETFGVAVDRPGCGAAAQAAAPHPR